MNFGNTVCGRPAQYNLNMLPHETSNSVGSDPNYGYISNNCYTNTSTESGQDTVSWSGQCTSVPNGSTTTFINVPEGYGTAACNNTLMSCAQQGYNFYQECGFPIPTGCAQNNCENQGVKYTGEGQTTIYTLSPFCLSNWDSSTLLQTDNVMKCCANMQASSDVCNPESCAENSDVCQPVMIQQCTPSAWTSNYQTECDTYLTLQSLINPTNAQNLILSAVTNFYSNNNPTADDPFVSKAVSLCSMYPGLCSDILGGTSNSPGVCNNYTINDLNPSNWTGRQNDPYGLNLLQTCGCFLQSNNYLPLSNISIPCNTVCRFPGTIPLANANGTAATCENTTCVIDNVTVDIINSNAGAVNLTQTCNQCNSSNPCTCYFSNININDNNTISPILLSQIETNCDLCYTFDPANPLSITQVPCTSTPPNPPTPPSPPSLSWLQKIFEFIYNNKDWFIGGFVVLILLIIILYIIIHYTRKK